MPKEATHSADDTDAGVPLLAFTSDIFDPTWMTPEQVKRRITEFFAAQGWDPIDR